jgi:hypothetical protein
MSGPTTLIRSAGGAVTEGMTAEACRAGCKGTWHVWPSHAKVPRRGHGSGGYTAGDVRAAGGRVHGRGRGETRKANPQR